MSRQIDALIAEKVMGLVVGEVYSDSGEYESHYANPQDKHPLTGQDLLPHYSTSIVDAWRVVEKIEGQVLIDRTISGKWVCEIIWGMRYTYVAEADTAPMAICLAALKAVGYED